MRAARGEQGMTLAELMVSMLILAVVTSGVLAATISIHRGFRYSEQDSATLAALRVTLDRFEKEVRQARRMYEDSNTKLVHFWVDYDGDFAQDLDERINWQIRDLGSGRAEFVRFTDAAPADADPLSDILVFDAAATDFTFSGPTPLESARLGISLRALGLGSTAEARTVSTEVRLRNYALD